VTCIVGIVHNGSVYMGGDASGVAEYNIQNRRNPKVFQNGPFLIGYMGSFRMGQILQYKFKPPVQKDDEDDMYFMVTSVIDAIRKCFNENGFSSIKNNEEEGGFFLIGYKGKLYEIQSDYHVAVHYEPYTAIGSGDAIALGSLHSTEKLNLSPYKRIKWALQAAERFNCSVRGPFVIKKLDENQQKDQKEGETHEKTS